MVERSLMKDMSQQTVSPIGHVHPAMIRKTPHSVTSYKDAYRGGRKQVILAVLKTDSDISTTLIQVSTSRIRDFNLTNSRFQFHEFTISTLRIQVHELTSSTSRIHEFSFTNSTSRIQLHEFTISTSCILEFNFTNSTS